MVQSSFKQKCKSECWKKTLLKKHFRENKKYYKVFNKNNIKVSYQLYGQYNKNHKFSQQLCCFQKDPANQILCTCKNHDNCSLDNKYITSKIVYSGKIITNNQQPSKVYLGIRETKFKTGLTFTKSLSDIGRMKKIQNSLNTSGS